MSKIVPIAGIGQDNVVLVLDAVRKADRFAKGLESDLQTQFGIETLANEREGLHPAALQFIGSICDMDIMEYLRLQSIVELFNFIGEARAAGHEIPDWAQAWDS